MKAKLLDADPREMRGAQRRAKPSALDIFSETADPHEGIVIAYRTVACSMQVVADAFGVHTSTVNLAVRRAEMRDSRI